MIQEMISVLIRCHLFYWKQQKSVIFNFA